jgi:hypothetical protein
MNEKSGKLKKKIMKYSILFAFGLSFAQNRSVKHYLKTGIYIQRIFRLCQKISSAG